MEVKSPRVFREIPVMIEDAIEERAKMLVLELKALTGLPFVLRKSRYGVTPSQYRTVVSLNGAFKPTRDSKNVIRVTLPDVPEKCPYGLTGQEQIASQMRSFAEKVHRAYFS